MIIKVNRLSRTMIAAALILAVLAAGSGVLLMKTFAGLSDQYTVEYAVTQAQMTGLGENLLNGSAPEIKKPDGGTVAVPAAYPYITDGVISTSNETVNLKADISTGTQTFTVTYDIGRSVTIEKALAAGYYQSAKDYGMSDYEIYVSEQKDTLYDEPNKVVKYDEVKWSASTSNSGREQLFTFDAAHRPMGRYVGLKILKANKTDNILRITEFGVYGAASAAEARPASTVDLTDLTQANYEALGTSRIAGKIPTPYSFKNEVREFTGNIGNWTDGNFGTIYTPALTGTGLFYSPDCYTSYVYDLARETQFQKIHINNRSEANLRTDYYRLYVSDSAGDVFNWKNVVAEFNNATNARAQTFTFTGTQPVGRYFGIRIFKPTPTTDNTVRLCEIGVFGIDPPALPDYTVDTATLTQDSYNQKGTSLLAGLVPAVTAPSGAAAGSGKAEWTDGSLDTNAFVDAPAGTCITYDLLRKVKMTQLVLHLHPTAAGMESYLPGQYEIYASTEAEHLYDAASKVAEYDNQTGKKLSQSILFRAGKEPELQYLGIKILKPTVGQDNSARFREIGLFGTGIEPLPPVAVTAMDDMTQAQYTALGDNLLKGVLPVIRDPNGDITSPNAGTPDISAWTDGNIGNNFMLNKNNGYKNGPCVTFEYALKHVTRFDKIVLAAHPVALKEYLIGEYKLYISMNAADLFADENEVAHFDNTQARSGVQQYMFQGDTLPVGKYVGIKVLKQTADPAKEDGIRLRDFAVFGSIHADQEWGYAKTETSADIAAGYAALGTSRILHQTAVIRDNTAKVVNPEDAAGNEKARMTDGDVTTAYSLGKSLAYKTGPYALIQFDMGTGYDIGDIALVHHNAIQTGLYQLYVSNTEEDLFSWYNLAGEHDNRTNTTQMQVFHFGGKKPAGRYFGIKVLKQTHNGSEDMIRLREVGVFGTAKTNQYTAQVTAQDAYSREELLAGGYNALNGVTPSVKTANKAAVLPTEGADGSAVTNWTDQDVATVYVLKTAEAYQAGPYADIIFKLKSHKNIQKIVVSSPAGEGFAPAKYELYISGGTDTLFSWENRIAVYENTDQKPVQSFTFLPTKKPEGAYFGIRVLRQNAAGATAGIAFSEIAVFADEVLPPEYEVEAPADITQAQLDALGTSLIKGKKPILRDNKNQDVDPATYEEYDQKENDRRKIDFWTNGSLTNPNYLISKQAGYKTGPSAGLIYDLGSQKVLDKIALALFKDISGYEIGEYRIYVSSSLNDIFASYNMVLSYNNQQNTTKAQIIRFNRNNPRGQYVGILITKPSASPADDAIRFRQIAVYGRDYTPAPTNLLLNLPVEAYRVSGSVKTRLSQSEFTNAMQKNLTNGNYTGLAADETAIDTKGQKLEIVYNLCKNYSIQQFKLFSADLASKYVGAFEVYAGMTEDEVWDPAKKLGSYTAGNPAQQSGSFDFTANPVSARYVRFSVTDPGESGICYLAELEAIGLDNQKVKNANLLAGINVDDTEAYYENKSTFRLTRVPSFPQKSDKYFLSNILDGIPGTLADFYGAQYGTETMDLVFNLGGLRAINTLEYTGLAAAPEYSAREIRYYIGESFEEVFGASAVPAAVVTDPDGTGGALRTEIVPIIGRYLRVSVVVPCDRAVAFADNAVTVIGDISALGIPVEGYTDAGGDESVVKSFTDEATGIKIDILKLDSSDIYRKAQSMRIVPGDLTAAQKDSLGDYGLSVYGGAFEIRFYDENGAPLTSLGGRSIRLRVPVEAGMSGLLFLGKAMEDEVVVIDALESSHYLVYNDSDLRSLKYVLIQFATDESDEFPLVEGDDPSPPTSDPVPPVWSVAAAVLFLAVPWLAIRKRSFKSINRKADH